MRQELIEIMKCILEGQSENSKAERKPALQVKRNESSRRVEPRSLRLFERRFLFGGKENDQTVQYENKQD